MLLTTFLVLFVTCTSQASSLVIIKSNGAQRWRTIFQVIEEFKPKISILRSKVLEQNDTLNASFEIVTTNVQLVLSRSEDEISNLDQVLVAIITEKLAQTALEGVDVETCLDQVSALQTQLHETAYEKIYEIAKKTNDNANTLIEQMNNLHNKLNGITNNANSVIKACLKEHYLPWQVLAFKHCLSTNIDLIENKIQRSEQLTNKCKATADIILKTLESEARENFQKALEKVLEIMDGLKECILTLRVSTEMPTTPNYEDTTININAVYLTH